MAFRCESCGIPQSSGTKLNKVVTQVRKVTYPAVRDNNGRIVKIPQGYETSREYNMCPECASKKYEVEVVGSKVLE